jgi:hypothetical protein
LGPIFFPAQRGFGHRPVHRQPIPVDPAQFVKLLHAGLPQRQEDPRIHPFLEPIMRRRMRAQLGLIQGLPLAAGA